MLVNACCCVWIGGGGGVRRMGGEIEVLQKV